MNSAFYYLGSSTPRYSCHDLALTHVNLPTNVSLGGKLLVSAAVANNGKVPESNVHVTAAVIGSSHGIELIYGFNNRSDPQGWSHSGINNHRDPWTQSLDDGTDNGNSGRNGDGSWSSGNGYFKFGPQRIYYDGENILVANREGRNILKIDKDTFETSVVIPTNDEDLRNVLDLTSDDNYYYTLARNNLFSSSTRICKWLKEEPLRAPSCVAGTVSYGTAISIYKDELFVLQTRSSDGYIIRLNSSTLAKIDSIDYRHAIHDSIYVQDIDVDEKTGNIFVVYRDGSGSLRRYTRTLDTYCSTCYKQTATAARYGTSVEVRNDYVYVMGSYGTSYYGGVKKLSTTLGHPSRLISWTDSKFKGSLAVTDSGDIYVSSNYAYNYYSMLNHDGVISYFKAPMASYNNIANRAFTAVDFYGGFGRSALSTPSINLANQLGFSMSFYISYNLAVDYHNVRDRADMEISTNGGSTWYHLRFWATFSSAVQSSARWEKITVSLDDYVGHEDVRVRWVVEYVVANSLATISFFRLDDVSMDFAPLLASNLTIDSLNVGESKNITFEMEMDQINWSGLGIGRGDAASIVVTVLDNGNDGDTSNQFLVENIELTSAPIPYGVCSAWSCPIKKAVDEYLNNETRQATVDQYGPIKDWDTSLVTDMSSLFDVRAAPLHEAAPLHHAIPDGSGCGAWNVRSCPIKKAVDGYLNTATRQATVDKYGPIKDWDTSLVTDMSSLFDADKIAGSETHTLRKAFNGDLSKWNTSLVTNMNGSKL